MDKADLKMHSHARSPSSLKPPRREVRQTSTIPISSYVKTNQISYAEWLWPLGRRAYYVWRLFRPGVLHESWRGEYH